MKIWKDTMIKMEIKVIMEKHIKWDAMKIKINIRIKIKIEIHGIKITWKQT